MALNAENVVNEEKRVHILGTNQKYNSWPLCSITLVSAGSK
jgi:hypothetical protein